MAASWNPGLQFEKPMWKRLGNPLHKTEPSHSRTATTSLEVKVKVEERGRRSRGIEIKVNVITGPPPAPRSNPTATGFLGPGIWAGSHLRIPP
ncbi:unnamed protein product [Arctogadus glacialis]